MHSQRYWHGDRLSFYDNCSLAFGNCFNCLAKTCQEACFFFFKNKNEIKRISLFLMRTIVKVEEPLFSVLLDLLG